MRKRTGEWSDEWVTILEPVDLNGICVFSRRCLLGLALLVLAGCAVEDSSIANDARTRLLGLKEVDLVSCLGGPDQHASYPGTDVLTWYATSSSSLSFSPPVIGGFSANNGGYCHVTVRLDAGVVTHVIYSGEKNATLAPNAYCAPILRSCIAELQAKAISKAPLALR